MKKVLVVLLSLCMVLGCFSFAFADTFTDVKADNEYLNAISVLSDLDILEGDGNGTFRPGDTLKRSEACVVLVKLLGYGAFAEAQTTTKFSDVPSSHWASGWVAYAANLGLIEGYGNGKFGPDDQLTYNQWLTMVMRAIGYKDTYLPGEWPTNFVVKASSIGLVTPELTGDKPMTRAEMAQVTYNSLEKPAVSYQMTITGEANELLSDGAAGHPALSTFLTKNGVTKNAAAVVPEGATGAAASHVGELGNTYVKDGKVVAFEASSDALVGTYKVASGKHTFITEGKTYEFATDPTADAINNTTGAAAADGIIDIAVADAVFVENADTAGGAYALVNGEDYVLNADLDANGKIAVLYSVEHWTHNDTVQFGADEVTALKAALAKTDLAAQPTFIGGYELPIKDKAVNTALVKGDLAAIKENTVVKVYVKNDGFTVSKIELSDESVTGAVTYIDNTKHTYTINGKAYAVDQYAIATIPGATSTDEVAFWLNADGDIYSDVVAPGVATDYAVVTLDAALDAAGYDTAAPAKVKLLTADGKTAVYTINSKYYKAAAGLNSNLAPFVEDTVVEYALNDAGEISKLAVVATTPIAAGAKFSKTTGILEGKLIADGAFIIVKDGTTPTWRLATADEIKATTTAAMAGKLNTANTAYEVLVLNAGDLYTAPAKKTAGVWKAIAVDDELVGKVNAKVSVALVNGEEVKMYDKAGTVLTTGAAIDELYELTVTDGFLTSASAIGVDKDYDVVKAPADGKIYLDTDGTPGESAGDEFFALASDVQVYVIDTTKKTSKVGTLADAKAGEHVKLYDLTSPTKDNVYDVVLVIK